MRSSLLLSLSIAVFTTACSSPKNSGETTSTTSVAKVSAPESNLGAQKTSELASVLDQYYKLKESFVKSDSTGVPAAAKGVSTALTAFANDSSVSQSLRTSTDSMQLALNSLAHQSGKVNLEQQRAAFEKVSDQMTAILKTAGWKNGQTYRQFCPMAFNDKGAHWLSNSSEIRNPYFGDRMLECGEVTDSL
jgi:Cu(I)/Ag(I) efflux system membrane fusion protein